MRTKQLFYVFLLMSINVFSQQKINIIGKITAENKSLSDAIVEFHINNISKFAITNNNGIYKFSDITLLQNDSLELRVKFLGYKIFIQKIYNLKENNTIDINLTVPEIENLKEVVINSKEKETVTAKKSSYKIAHKEFIENTKGLEVLATVPNLYVDKQFNTITVDGKLQGKLFIDGVEAMANELKTLDINDFDKVEVVNNPTGSYGSDFLGAIVNIITKKKKEEFIKGIFGVTAGIKNQYYSFDPSISYKKGRFIIKTNYNYLNSNNLIDYNLYRINGFDIFNSNTTTNSDNNRQYSDLKINVKLSEKSNFTLTNYYHHNNYNSTGNGFTELNHAPNNRFSKSGFNIDSNWKLGTVYDYKISENKHFYLKNSLFIYKKKDTDNYFYSDNTNANFNIETQNKEFTFNADYEAEDFKMFKKSSSFYMDLKYINRKYSFSDTLFFINQKVINATTELDNQWTDQFSTEMALSLENTSNKNISKTQVYNLVLPTFNALYHFKNKYDLKFGYSRKVLRPSVGDLNDNVIIINSGIAKQGNSNLDPQIRNYYVLTLSKSFKIDHISIRFYNESINNSIEEVYKTQENLIVQTLENAAKFSSTGISVGYRTKILKKINTNINSGFNYSHFEDTSLNAVIKTNGGYAFTGNINLSSKLFNDKVSVSFSGRHNNPNYSLLSKKITLPYLDFSCNTNLLKGNLNLSLYAQNLLGRNAAGFTDISSYNNFYQKIEARNNFTNLLFTLTYYFGKSFNDKIIDKTINNNDVRR
ncbi:hypothetical protein B0A58_02620 [Flavobacterium branchiophilum NBRC 15030 = ATCC 35035]|uniref:Outer membrane receptor protein involved in Fe transport n=1 Tax=Flavobacterium branchiophilum TaxID=55197 RepID=A0A543G6I4_9FLAO|nr:outer membrane beta-barrel protein [Flavobacterium branchiophilum]OXA80222.1 hypothetical protein B0A58_02620 [Flavobacterium branchiophilum NBRC 15030 = ATCC 35035]TQM41584.1 outer membrane receptor protein involved in Fe transport [Flavobacterium branchiophilum]GEM55657.1 TonB-dependent receptor [Flavobacterium branchiophilum NBRC 15030 = ATCC 35035]